MTSCNVHPSHKHPRRPRRHLKPTTERCTPKAPLHRHGPGHPGSDIPRKRTCWHSRPPDVCICAMLPVGVVEVDQTPPACLPGPTTLRCRGSVWRGQKRSTDPCAAPLAWDWHSVPRLVLPWSPRRSCRPGATFLAKQSKSNACQDSQDTSRHVKSLNAFLPQMSAQRHTELIKPQRKLCVPVLVKHRLPVDTCWCDAGRGRVCAAKPCILLPILLPCPGHLHSLAGQRRRNLIIEHYLKVCLAGFLFQREGLSKIDLNLGRRGLRR